MKRGALKPGTKPMKRGKPMVARRKHRPKINGIDYLGLCRGQECYLRLPFVPAHPIDTVVPAHSNQRRDGKGAGIKASDEKTVPACFYCHSEIDQGKLMSREEKFAAWDAAYARWSKYRETLIQREAA